MKSQDPTTKIIWSAVLAGLIIIVLSALAWRNLANKSEAPSAGQQAAASAQPPVLRPEPPKLAGHVLIGTKTKTKYYLAKDGKRYVFPDDTNTFETWYPSGTQAPITHLSQDELESYPLGGNVWYKPGTRLIHISTDQNIYVVAHGGVLRAANTGMLEQIFGTDWKSRLDLLQDYYFTNYKIGEPILAPTQYSPAIEMGKSQTIDMDKGIE